MTAFTAAEIACALGGHRHAGYWTAKCPAHDDRSPSLSIRESDDGTVLVKCHASCSQDAVIDALRARGLWPNHRERRERAAPVARPQNKTEPTDTERIEKALRIWGEASSPFGSLVERYLKARGCDGLLPEIAGRAVRFHPDCVFGKERHPAMIALMRNIRTDEPRAIHRTALDASGLAILRGGNKLKLVLGPMRDAAIKLDADENVSDGLGIAEGIETALSVMTIGWRPVWALGNAGAMQRFPVLCGVEALTIFADNDTSGAGLTAARDCTARWRLAGRAVRVFMPRERRHDWNDVVLT